MKILLFILSFSFISSPLFSAIDWAGNWMTLKRGSISSQDPIIVFEHESIQFFAEVYKRGITEDKGKAQGFTTRLYVDVPSGTYLPMTYIKDAQNNDLYSAELKPFSLRPGVYEVAMAFSDESVAQDAHWSDGNFYWLTRESYGYTNPNYPNHEWLHSFRTLEVLKSNFIDIYPVLENKK